MNKRKNRQSGFSIIELMVAVTVLGILLALAVPSFQAVMDSNRIVAQHNEFIGALSMARSEAVKRGSTVTVCPSTDAASCAGSTTWNTGWISFTDPNANGAVDAGETILQVAPAPAGNLALTSPSFTSIRYSASGMLMGPAGTFRLEKSGCTGDKAREISIAITGRVSTTRVNCTT